MPIAQVLDFWRTSITPKFVPALQALVVFGMLLARGAMSERYMVSWVYFDVL